MIYTALISYNLDYCLYHIYRDIPIEDMGEISRHIIYSLNRFIGTDITFMGYGLNQIYVHISNEDLIMLKHISNINSKYIPPTKNNYMLLNEVYNLLYEEIFYDVYGMIGWELIK